MIECKMCKLHVSHRGGFCNGKKEACSQIHNNLAVMVQGTVSNTYLDALKFERSKIRRMLKDRQHDKE